MPVSVVLTNLAVFCFQLVLFLCFFFVAWWFGVPVHPNARLIVLPFLLLEMAALGIGVGCIVAAATVRYRDLAMLIQFGVQLWMFGSCVVYPLELVSEQYRTLFILNPMVPIIESFRYAFLGFGVIELWQLLLSMGITAVVLVLGLIAFSHVERTHLDSI